MDIDGTHEPDIGIADSQFNISSTWQWGTPRPTKHRQHVPSSYKMVEALLK
jgi:hypothetical protein